MMSKRRIALPLPDELTEMILLRLSAFDLVRCQGVCKAWRSLISSAGFVSAHLERSKSDPLQSHLLVYNKKIAGVDGPFSSFICFTSLDLLVVGSINGLICTVGNDWKNTGFPAPDEIWILNPVTGLSRKLPYSPNSPRLLENIRKVMFAFWCDCDDNDDDDSAVVYKVAKIVSYCDGASMLEVWVSTSPDTWSVISTFEFLFSWTFQIIHGCDVLIEQGPAAAAYWVVVNHKNDVFVASLDLKTLRLEFNPFSIDLKALMSGRLTVDLKCVLFGGNLNGELVLITYGGLYYDVWTMVKDGGWMKKFAICFDSFPFEECLGDMYPDSYRRVQCLGMMNDKLILTSHGALVLATYDLVTGILRVLDEPASKMETLWAMSAHCFVGSLVSIHGFEVNNVLCNYIQFFELSSNPMGRRLERYLRKKERYLKKRERNLRKREVNKKILSLQLQLSDEEILECYRYVNRLVQLSNEDIQNEDIQKYYLRKCLQESSVNL